MESEAGCDDGVGSMRESYGSGRVGNVLVDVGAGRRELLRVLRHASVEKCSRLQTLRVADPTRADYVDPGLPPLVAPGDEVSSSWTIATNVMVAPDELKRRQIIRNKRTREQQHANEWTLLWQSKEGERERAAVAHADWYSRREHLATLGRRRAAVAEAEAVLVGERRRDHHKLFQRDMLT